MPKSRAVVCTAIDRVECQEVNIPEPTPGEVLVRNLLTCISPGTELRCIAGKQPGLTEFPFIPGYAAVGIVVQGTAALPEGSRVIHGGTRSASIKTAWGGHVEFSVAEASGCIALPDSDDLVAACAARLAGIAYRGVRAGQPQPHERVAIVGLGAIGQSSARLFNASGALVIGIDAVEERRARLIAAGIPAVSPEEASAHFGGFFDIVVDATGAEAALNLSVKLAKDHSWQAIEPNPARLVIQGSYPHQLGIPYQSAFEKELTVKFPRNVVREDMVAVMDLHRRQRVDLRQIVTRLDVPENAAACYKELQEQPGTLTIAFRWAETAASP